MEWGTTSNRNIEETRYRSHLKCCLESARPKTGAGLIPEAAGIPPPAIPSLSNQLDRLIICDLGITSFAMTVVSKGVFVATHPRSCSTAFERVFMTRQDILQCVHEPFGDAFYFGPERLSLRYEKDDEAREKSGFGHTTYRDVLRNIEKAGEEGKRVFIKDIAYYLFSPDDKPTRTAPSLSDADEPDNPTTLPLDVLRRFQFTFLIRHPRRSIPSYYRCTVPPLSTVTGFDYFLPSEAGYMELRRLVDYLVRAGVVDRRDIVVVDADDMLDRPDETIRAYCARIGIDFSPQMLTWSEGDTERATEAFEKWNGFHNDAIGSSSLKPRTHAHVSPTKPASAASSSSLSPPSSGVSSGGSTQRPDESSSAKKTATTESDDKEWREKYGEEGQKAIRACVEENIPHYDYLRQFILDL